MREGGVGDDLANLFAHAVLALAVGFFHRRERGFHGFSVVGEALLNRMELLIRQLGKVRDFTQDDLRSDCRGVGHGDVLRAFGLGLKHTRPFAST